MSLSNMKPLLEAAEKQNAAVGSFSVSSLEMIGGVLKAAEEKHTPVILQVAECRLKHTPLRLLGPAMLAGARNASVPVCVHLDHGLTRECVSEALELGFTSVMFDGSSCDMEQNIRLSAETAALARTFGADCEGEVGVIGRSEDGREVAPRCADPGESIRFARETGVTAMAVAIGNAHGIYKGAPQLRFDLLEKIRKGTSVPLVLHGGSGISEADFRRCISLGIRKINIATAIFMACHAAAGGAGDYFDYSARAEEAVYKTALQHLDIFGCFSADKETEH